MIISEALGKLRKLSVGPSYRTHMMNRLDTIKLRLKSDGISENERGELKR